MTKRSKKRKQKAVERAYTRMVKLDAKGEAVRDADGNLQTYERRINPLPEGKQKADRERERLARTRQHRKEWKEPNVFDYEQIWNLHFSEHSFNAYSHHAEATLEIPTKDGFVYHSETYNAKTAHDAVLGIADKIKHREWFKKFKERKIVFRVTGTELERIYRGYL